MSKHFLLHFAVGLTLLTGFISADSPDTLWSKTFGGEKWDGGLSVVETLNGDFIIAGYSESETGGTDVYLVRTTASGDVVWTRKYGGEEDDWAESICVSSDGYYVVAGTTFSFGEVFADVWLLKIDDDGDTVWSQTYGEEAGDFGWSVCEHSGGGYLITGDSYSGGGGWNAYLVKTDKDGNELWTQSFGGSKEDLGAFVIESSDTTYLIVGYSESFHLSDYDFYLVMTDTAGNVLWERNYGGEGWNGYDDAAYGVCKTSGGYLVTGAASSFGAGNTDLWVLKIDDAGDSLWSKTYGGEQNDWGEHVCPTSNGFLITGCTYSYGAGEGDLWLLKIDALGDTQWTRTYGSQVWDAGYCGIQTSDGAYVVTGETGYPPAGDDGDVWLLKLESEIALQEESVRPDPIRITSTFSRLEYDLSCRAQLGVYSVDGRKVAGQELIGTGVWVPPGLSRGVYFVKVSSKDCSRTLKLIVTK